MVLSNVGAVYEAIVMGGHRIDLARKFGTAFTILEAIAIVVFLYEGYGLVAMTAVMAISEVGYLLCCYFVSRRILPAIQIATKHLSRSVLGELSSFAGSYQLVGILEMMYAAILPVVIMKFYGANAAGIYALACRLVGVAQLPQGAFLQPVLSAGSMVFASSSVETMRDFLAKSFRTTFALALLPLAFMASHGTLIVFVWTGLADPAMRMVLGLTCLAGLFGSLSLLELVLYRASGRTWMDNIRQVLRLVVLLLVSIIGDRVGLFGLLCAVVIAEFVGMIFMFPAITSVFRGLTVRMLAPDAVKLMTATVALIAIGIMVANVPVPWAASERILATLKLGVIVLATLVAVLPILLWTGSLTRSEVSTIMQIHKAKG
jgi:O-antigen/teichoic acid export membrane protein